jgi:hypothetical protein
MYYLAAATGTREACGATCAATNLFARPGVMATTIAGGFAATAAGTFGAAARGCNAAFAIAGF